jgi:hypothetical protein
MSSATSPALQVEALYAKSQVYIRKGLRAKHDEDLEEYQLWASLALELLGKAGLSSIHPALIADPTHFQSLFAACGHQISPDIKTITAKTLFPRLAHISKRFDARVQVFCEQLSLRRNSEIHSGESPFSGMKADAWEKKYWHAIEVILELQEKNLDQWLGAEDSKAPKQMLADADAAIQMAVETRISHAKEVFLANHKNTAERVSYIKQLEAKSPREYWRDFDTLSLDGYEINACPSCGARGVVGGLLWHEEVSDDDNSDDPYFESVERTYSAEEFLCKVCNLRLLGTREIEASDLSAEFFETEVRERVFEPDYGND